MIKTLIANLMKLFEHKNVETINELQKETIRLGKVEKEFTDSIEDHLERKSKSKAKKK